MSGDPLLRSWGAESLQALFGLRLTPTQEALTEKYMKLLLKWRRAINLTGRSSPAEILQLDFFEAFWVADHFLEGTGRLVDVGSGAGFPGLAFKLRRPDLQVTLMEPNSKKIAFLRETARHLRLPVDYFAGRVEEYREWSRQDLVSLRALKPSPGLLAALSSHHLRLLWLHGTVGRLPGDLQLCRRLPIPGSRQRFASLLDCEPGGR